MEIRQILQFMAVAESGSFCKAAARCCISQSAISQQIKLLEEEVGASLFFRNTHIVRLTEDGENFLPYAQEVARNYNIMMNYAKELRNGVIQGELNIGIGSFIEPYLRKAAAEMIKRYPNVRMNVVFEKASLLNRLLRQGELDIAFTMNQSREDEGIESEHVLDFHLTAVMRKDHPLALQKEVTFDELLKEKVILPDVGERALKSFRKYYDVPIENLNTVIVVNNAEAACNMVILRNLITFLPKMYVNTHPELIAKSISGLENPLPCNVHRLQGTIQKRSAKVFLDLVRKYN